MKLWRKISQLHSKELIWTSINEEPSLWNLRRARVGYLCCFFPFRVHEFNFQKRRSIRRALFLSIDIGRQLGDTILRTQLNNQVLRLSYFVFLILTLKNFPKLSVRVIRDRNRVKHSRNANSSRLRFEVSGKKNQTKNNSKTITQR